MTKALLLIALFAGIFTAVETGVHPQWSGAALAGKYPFFAATAQKVPPAHATEPQRAEGETVAFVTSPVIDPDPQFFFGTGDGSNGSYGSGKPTLVRYAQMP